MLAPQTIEPLTLFPRSIHRLENARGKRVTCVQGPVWLTQQDDPRDVILASGQSFVLDRQGVAVVYAFRGATITVAPAWQETPGTSVPVQATGGGGASRGEPVRAYA